MKMLIIVIALLLLAKLPCFCVVILIMSVTCIWNMIKKNWSIPCHPSRMNLYWTGCEIWLVEISRMSKEFQRPLKLNGTALFPSDLDTETVSWHFLPADAYCLQIWIENALDHLGMSQHKAFHLHQLLKWKI